MKNDLEKQRQEFIVKFGFEPTPQELDNYINNKLNSQVFENIETTTYTPSNGSTSGWLVLLWFACSFGAIFYLSGLEKTIELMLVFGHYFLVFGIMAFLSSKNVENMNLLFVLGIVFLFSVLFLPGQIQISIDPDRFMFLILGLIFFVTGLVFLSKVIKAKILKGKFVKIDAYVSDYIGDDDMKACVFEYEYEGKKYVKNDNIFSSGPTPAIGSIKSIRINPNKPDEIYATDMSWFFIIMAIPFTLMGGLFVLVGLSIIGN